jgi:hypothetical protein
MLACISLFEVDAEMSDTRRGEKAGGDISRGVEDGLLDGGLKLKKNRHR